MECPNCGKQNAEGAKFCMWCGAEILQRCQKCGTGNPPGARFCAKCGRAITPASITRRAPARQLWAWLVLVLSGALVVAGLTTLIWFMWPRLELPIWSQTAKATSTALAALHGANASHATATAGVSDHGATPDVTTTATLGPTSSPSPSLTPTATASQTPTQTPTPTASQTPTQTPSPTPSLTLTPRPSPRPTSTPLPSCPFDPSGTFASVWRTYRGHLGCPLERSPKVINDAEQSFQNGHMFWRADTDQAYVVYESGARKGSFQVFTGAWSEGQPEYSCTASPPAGFIQPKRGFGAVWCMLGAANSPTGWALGPEAGFGPGNGDPLVQDFEHGTIFRDSDGLRRRMAYVLFDDLTFIRTGY